MGSKWFTGGVVAAPRGRIQFDFILDGVRYRPTIKRPPSEANLRRARERLEVIKNQIELGTFSFEEEFPDYRFPTPERHVKSATKARVSGVDRCKTKTGDDRRVQLCPFCGWGGRIIRPCGPHPFGAVRGALTRVTAQTNQPP
jgi:hypothetical protein